MYCYRILSVFKHIYNVVFRRKFSKELLSLKNVAFLKKVGSNCQYNVKSHMDYSHLVVFIILIIYLSIYFTPCFYFGLLAWLLRTMPLLRKLKNRLLGLNHVVFSEKIENRTFGSEAYCFFHDISSKWQYVSIRSRKMLYVVSW